MQHGYLHLQCQLSLQGAEAGYRRSDFQSRLDAISDEQLLEVLERSEQKMAETANATLRRAQVAVGLRSESGR